MLKGDGQLAKGITSAMAIKVAEKKGIDDRK